MCQGTKRAAELASPISFPSCASTDLRFWLCFPVQNFFLLTSTPAASLRFSFPFEWRRPSTAQSTVILACRPRDRSVCFFFSAGLVRGSAFRQLGSVSGFHSALRFSPLSSPAQERGQDPFPLCVLSSCAPNFLLREDLFRCQQCRRSGFPSTRIFTVGYSRFSGLCLRGISFAAVSPVPPFGLRRCASTRAQELPSRLCAVHEVEASLLVCGAFCSVEVTRLRETKVSMIFVIGLFDLYMDLCR
jgi:hypothetical protein